MKSMSKVQTRQTRFLWSRRKCLSRTSQTRPMRSTAYRYRTGKCDIGQKSNDRSRQAAAGDEITLILEKKVASDAQKAQLGDDAAFTDVKLLSGGKEITDLGTAKITVELPVSDTLCGKDLRACLYGCGRKTYETFRQSCNSKR